MPPEQRRSQTWPQLSHSSPFSGVKLHRKFTPNCAPNLRNVRPEIWPTAYAMVSTVKPKARDTPRNPIPRVGNPAARTALPQPANVNQKVPKNSAPRRRCISIARCWYAFQVNGFSTFEEAYRFATILAIGAPNNRTALDIVNRSYKLAKVPASKIGPCEPVDPPRTRRCSGRPVSAAFYGSEVYRSVAESTGHTCAQASQGAAATRFSSNLCLANCRQVKARWSRKLA